MKKSKSKTIVNKSIEDKSCKREYKSSLIFFVIIIMVFQAGFVLFMYYEINELNNKINSQVVLSKLQLATNSPFLDNRISDKISQINEDLTNIQTKLDTKSKIYINDNPDFTKVIDDTKKSIVSLRTDVSQGSGFFIDKNGYLITNSHVLENARIAVATTIDKKNYNLELIGYDPDLDIALLKVKENINSPYLKFEDSNKIRLGQNVIAIGDAMGLTTSVTKGIVSGLNRKNSNGLPYYIQTDAPLNPGNSGGPLIDSNGKVIGINNFKISGGENMGFALESNHIVKTINRISNEKLNIDLVQ